MFKFSLTRGPQPHRIQSEARPIFEKRFYRLQFSFVVSLILRLTEKFEIVCLCEKQLILRDPRTVFMCRFVGFFNKNFRAVYRAFDFM